MKKLCELVDIAFNNEKCVAFQVKKDAKMDMIALGCFNGNEELIRMTKGRTPEITIFENNGTNYAYHFGEGGTTVLSGSKQEQRAMIRECVILDFGIICDISHGFFNGRSDESLLKSTLKVKELKDARRNIEIVSGGGMVGNIRVNEQTVATDIQVKDIAGWFKKRGYNIRLDEDISKGLPCGKISGYCAPLEKDRLSLDERLVVAGGKQGESKEFTNNLERN